MEGIMKYFTKSSSECGGVSTILVETPPTEGIQIQKKQHLCLTHLDENVELFIEKGWSEFSITFRQEYRNIMDDLSIKKALSRALRLLPGVQYVLYPEYGKNHNLHYHGIIKGTNYMLSLVKGTCNRTFGRTYIRSIQYTESYFKYMKKERNNLTRLELLKLIIFRVDKLI